MKRPALPSFSARSLSRWILLICVVIAIGWPFRLTVVEGERKSLYREAVDAYQRQDFERCADLMDRTISVSRPADSTAVLLREQATCYGYAERYAKQLNALVRAKRVADKVGQDSVAREAAISIANVMSFCQKESSECEAFAQTQTSSWKLSSPFMIILLCLAAIGMLYVIGADQLTQQA